MNQQLIDDTGTLWRRLVESHKAFSLASGDFLTKAANRVETLREALRGRDRDTALLVARSLPIDDQKQLFSEWVHLARCAHSPFEPAWKIILSLPREWVLDRIEREVEPILSGEEYDDYWMFLQLFEQLDRNLTLKTARRAAAHADPEIRELGEEYLQKLSVPANDTP